MTQGIKAKDIRDFEKYARKLNEVIERIVEYQPDARIFVTPQQINLMAGFGEDVEETDQELVVAEVVCHYAECGDW